MRQGRARLWAWRQSQPDLRPRRGSRGKSNCATGGAQAKFGGNVRSLAKHPCGRYGVALLKAGSGHLGVRTAVCRRWSDPVGRGVVEFACEERHTAWGGCGGVGWLGWIRDQYRFAGTGRRRCMVTGGCRFRGDRPAMELHRFAVAGAGCGVWGWTVRGVDMVERGADRVAIRPTAPGWGGGVCGPRVGLGRGAMGGGECGALTQSLSRGRGGCE